jgi:ribonuclease BN (tRNA processing enzyme)
VGYPDSGPSPEVLALYRGADLLIHDCTYTPEDRASRRDRGFSSFVDAAAAAVAAGVKHLVMFHYDQDYGDELVDALRSACRAELDRRGGGGIALTAAAEGLVLEV